MSKTTTTGANKTASQKVKKTATRAKKATEKTTIAARREVTELRAQAADKARELGNEVRQTSRNLWLAGLGTVATIDDRRRQVWGELVKSGERFENKNNLPKPLRRASEQAQELGDKVESRVEQGFTKALGRLGVPSRTDVHQLIARIEQLTKKVEALSA